MSIDALLFRVSSDRQTIENQLTDLLEIAQRDDSGRDWARIRDLLGRCIVEEQRPGAGVLYRVVLEIAEELAQLYIYVEQGKSGKVGAAHRPMFERMKRDAAAREFDRLLVWKVSRLGRNMREVINTVWELADLNITVFPVKSQTGPITSMMGKLLWAILAWFAEMENEEKSHSVKAGQVRARAEGKHVGRPRVIFDRERVVQLKEQGRSWTEIAQELHVSVGTVRRAYRDLKGSTTACQKCVGEAA